MSAQWSTASLSAGRFVLAATSLDKQQLALFAGGYQYPGAVLLLRPSLGCCANDNCFDMFVTLINFNLQKECIPMWWTFSPVRVMVQAHGQRHGSVRDVKIWQRHLYLGKAFHFLGVAMHPLVRCRAMWKWHDCAQLSVWFGTARESDLLKNAIIIPQDILMLLTFTTVSMEHGQRHI